MWTVHDIIIRCSHMGNHERMNVETSKHDELCTTRRRVTMNVDIETLTTVNGDETSAVVVSVNTNDECGSVTNLTWRRSLRTPRMTATVTAMTYAATCHRERVHSITAGL